MIDDRGAIYFTELHSPIGTLLVSSDGDALTGIEMDPPARCASGTLRWRRDPTRLRPAIEELGAYFAGELTVFTVPIRAPFGTPFQRAVWAALRTVEHGTTASYRDIAIAIGNPGAVRGVGAANRRNPIPIIVPCHRVIGADGSLTGYGGGVERKQWLLAHEARSVAAALPGARRAV